MATGLVRPHSSEANTIQALMDLDLPRFEGLGHRPRQVHPPWMVSTESPASPDPGDLPELLQSSSPCLSLDALSSDDTGGSVGLSNFSVTLLCGSDDGHTPVNSDNFLSDEDLPPEAGSDDRRFVIYLRMFRLWIFLKSVRLGIPDGQCPWVAQVSGCHYPFAFWPRLQVAGL